ncbi:MAG: undecaprenyl-diphosphate phosphatase [Gammaproteobacteria bacterium]|nr:undecaprenyl-diphosphate phosphatase [Gammaproteobacteria bacterium]
MAYTLFWQALVLGTIEGLTEFLPVSSTGHLILAGQYLEFTRADAKTFEVVIQLGAILAVCWHFRARLLGVVTTLGSTAAQRFVSRLLLAFLPVAVLGVALHGFIKQVLYAPQVVAWALLVGGFVILFIERRAAPTQNYAVEDLSPLLAFKIGCAQALALVPGVSRSGATIMGALWLGVSRQSATEFSFFLAIPVMFAATAFDLLKSWQTLSPASIPLFAVGLSAAFLSALVAIRCLLHFVANHSFVAFAWYRIALGLLTLWLLPA